MVWQRHRCSLPNRLGPLAERSRAAISLGRVPERADVSNDPFAGRRPSGTSVPPEFVAWIVGGATVLLAAAIVGGILLLNTARSPVAQPLPSQRAE